MTNRERRDAQMAYIADEERKYYFKDREFDAEAWAAFNK